MLSLIFHGGLFASRRPLQAIQKQPRGSVIQITV